MAADMLTSGLLHQRLHNTEASSLMSPSAPVSVMWCSAAVDILFLLDGSHSVGKGSFERSKHFAMTVCDALDISPGRVSTRVLSGVCGFKRQRLSFRQKNESIVGCRGLRGKSKRDGVMLGSRGSAKAGKQTLFSVLLALAG